MKQGDSNHNISYELVPILDYIDANLEHELTLDFQERKFFIDRNLPKGWFY